MPSEHTLCMIGGIRRDSVSIELAILHFGKPAPGPVVNIEPGKADQASSNPGWSAIVLGRDPRGVLSARAR